MIYRFTSLNYYKTCGTRTFCRKILSFVERHFAERTFCRRTLCRTNILSNGQWDERTFRRKDILPKRQHAKNREILGVVTHFSKMCNSQSLCNYKITIVWSLPYFPSRKNMISGYFTKTRIKATHSLLRKCTMHRAKERAHFGPTILFTKSLTFYELCAPVY